MYFFREERPLNLMINSSDSGYDAEFRNIPDNLSINGCNDQFSGILRAPVWLQFYSLIQFPSPLRKSIDIYLFTMLAYTNVYCSILLGLIAE